VPVEDNDTKESVVEKEQVNEWMTPAEMRRLLGLSKNKTFEILASGQVEAIKLGRCVRVNRESLEQLISQSPYKRGKTS
jgi:excisionase family DNA binding protein